MADNSQDPKAYARKTDAKKRLQITKKLVITTLMSSAEGRRYIWSQLEDCHIFGQTFVASAGSAALTAFNEGRRSVGLALLADIHRWAAIEYSTMVAEAAGLNEEPEDGGRHAEPDPDASSDG